MNLRERIKSASTEPSSYRCVVTFEYANGPFEVASKAIEHDAAMRLFNWHVKLNGQSKRAIQARVYSEADYRSHQQRRVAGAVLQS
jgi:hypothetical protein